MIPKINRSYRKFYVLLCLLCLCAFFSYCAGYRFNGSYSVPTGIWKIHSTAGSAQKNDYAAIPPKAQPAYEFTLERGYFRSGGVLLKKVTASSGDVIDYDTEEESVTVNGEYLPYTKILSEDTQGRPLYGTKFPIILKKGQVWLSSENVRGYDSRYFGPVSGELIIKAIPVLLF